MKPTIQEVWEEISVKDRAEIIQEAALEASKEAGLCWALVRIESQITLTLEWMADSWNDDPMADNPRDGVATGTPTNKL